MSSKGFSLHLRVITCGLITLLLLSSWRLATVHAQSWESLGGSTLSSPAVKAIYVDGGWRVDVVVRGIDDGVYHKYWRGASGWSGWTALGGLTCDQPAIAYAEYHTADTLHVIVRGMDNGVYYKKLDLATGIWDVGWTPIPNLPRERVWYTSSTPVLVTHSYLDDGILRDTLLLFLRGLDDHVYYSWWQDDEALVMQADLLGLTNDVPAIGITDDHLHLVVRGMKNGIYHRQAIFVKNESITWSPSWERLPGTTLSAPVMSSRYLVVRGSDNALYFTVYSITSHSWLNWITLGGGTSDHPTLYYGSGYLHLYVCGMDKGGIYGRRGENGDYLLWDPWMFMEGHTSSSPTISGRGSSTTYLCVRGTDDHIYFKWIYN